MTARGESDGRRDHPAASAAQLSEAETAVVRRVEGALSQTSAHLLGSETHNDYSTLPQDLETLAGEPHTILTQFRGRKARAQSAAQIELANAYTDFERAYRGYRLFRRQHELTDVEPRYDTVFWRKVYWLTLLFSIEVGANGWVIGQAAPGGLVQGWTTALLISVLVVLTGTLIGVGPWRYLSYRGVEGRGRVHRAWAAPAVVLGAAALIFFAFYVAHYRSALAATPLDAPVPNDILTSMFSAPFAPFQQLESLVLFVVALLIGIFAIERGAHWDDPYPGYGPVHRRMMEERERTQNIAMGLSAEVDGAKDQADAALDDVAAKSQHAIGTLRRALARAQDYGAEWDRTSAEIVNVGRDAIARYRNANRDARRAPEPAYFSEDPFAAMAPPSIGAVIATLETAQARATANITQCKSQLAGARAQLEAEYKSFYEDELSPFLKGVGDIAATKVREEFADGGAAAGPAATGQPAEVLPLQRRGAS